MIREDIINSVMKEKLVVIVRGVCGDDLMRLAEAMHNGGIRLLEYTYSANGAVKDEETAQNIKRLATHFAGEMHIGAGTVITAEQVNLTKAAGGEFIISPDTFSDVIRKTVDLGLVSMPGALSPSEIQAAHRLGADFVKVFPAVNLGPEYIKAIKAPLSHIKLLAVGGVNLDNMNEYLKAGVCGFGIGANIVDKKLIENGDFKGITELAKRYVAAVNGELKL